jgi:transcriptional regulator with XRE-family HTH domain
MGTTFPPRRNSLPPNPPGHLADNMRLLREARGLTQQQVARLAGVPRPTWSNLESGGANPTLSVLMKVAAALAVSVEELISPPRAAGKHYTRAELPVRRRGRGVEVRRLLPETIVAGSIWQLQAGDVVVFRGDQKHGYKNPGPTTAVAYSIVAFAPVS